MMIFRTKTKLVPKRFDVGNTFTRCLDSYFIGDDVMKNVDVVLTCSPKQGNVPPTFTDELMIRCNSADLVKPLGKCGSDKDCCKNKCSDKDCCKNKCSDKDCCKNNEQIRNIRKNVTNIVKSYLRGQDYSVESWVEFIVYNYPMNSNGLPVSYPNHIDSTNINDTKISAKDLFVEYDFRAKSYEHESNFIGILENAFESLNTNVVITNTYNDILTPVKKALDKKHRKYTSIDDNAIRTKFKYLNDLNIPFQITDFI